MALVAWITGITGQDGSYLAEFLLAKGYIVYGMIRRSSSLNTERIEHIVDRLILRYGDITDGSCLVSILTEIKTTHPDQVIEVYNLAAQSHVKISFDVPLFSAHATGLGCLYLLDAIRICGLAHLVKFYQASSSEMFGKVREVPQTEKTPFHPRSPYGCAKQFAHSITINYREAYGMFACCGILFNHESPRRPINFVTRKITLGVAKILRGNEKELVLGNLEARRDWGHARCYTEAMWRILQQETPKDYVVASGEEHSVREFVELCFSKKGIDIEWEGKGLDEVGKDKTTGRVYVRVDAKYFRYAEVDTLLGDASLARNELGWSPTTSFDQLVDEMLSHDCGEK
jgi:GDPmannose 4,6-dehydratase